MLLNSTLSHSLQTDMLLPKFIDHGNRNRWLSVQFLDPAAMFNSIQKMHIKAYLKPGTKTRIYKLIELI